MTAAHICLHPLSHMLLHICRLLIKINNNLMTHLMTLIPLFYTKISIYIQFLTAGEPV